MDASTYPLLSGLARVGACSAAELGREIGLDRSGVSRRATHFGVVGLLSRRTDSTDARAARLELTSRGQVAVETLRMRLTSEIDALFEDRSESETRSFAEGFVRSIESEVFAQ